MAGWREREQILETNRRALASGRPPALLAIDEAMERYARGEVAAFDQLYGMAAPRVRGFLLRMCGNLALAEDLTQETFLRVSRARGSFEERAAAIPLDTLDRPQRSLRSRRRARTRGEVASKGEASPDSGRRIPIRGATKCCRGANCSTSCELRSTS